MERSLIQMEKQPSVKAFMNLYGLKIAAVCFWLLLWEIVSILIGQEILLASPVEVVKALIALSQSVDFWQAILFSSFRIILGFSLALLTGTVLAVASYKNRVVRELITPFLKIIQAMPVASFIILALVWVKARNLSVLASFLMVMPLIYANMIQGLEAADRKLLEMAKVFRLSRMKRIIAIYIPAVMPHFIAAVSVGVGLCWKAGIAAEVIGIPTGSIGERLYEAKLYLMTKELFAWTIVIIVISILFERAVMRLLRFTHNGTVTAEKETEKE
jgi:NitT/TauT family transport system permease protein